MNVQLREMGRKMKLASVPILLASLAACATPFKADVSRFQTQLPAPQGESFAVVADDPKLAGGLEFAQYARHVEEQMAQLGYAPASPENASLLVRFDYGVDKGREKLRSTGFRDPFFDPWYRGYRGRFYRSRQEVRSITVFTSGIDMKIDRTATGERLFEGKAEALSTSNRLPYLVPNLVEAMFTDFPGSSSGKTEISLDGSTREATRVLNALVAFFVLK